MVSALGREFGRNDNIDFEERIKEESEEIVGYRGYVAIPRDDVMNVNRLMMDCKQLNRKIVEKNEIFESEDTGSDQEYLL